MTADKCDNCGVSWRDDREIPVVLFEETDYYPTMQEAEEAARSYGWTPENGMRPGKNVIGIEYDYRHPLHYDGVSEWKCEICKARIGRWTGKQLEADECERPFGGR